MSDLSFAQADSAPSVFGNLTHPDGTVFDLTDATVRFQMRLLIDRRFTVDYPAVILVAADGTVRYDWQAGDLDTAGDYVSSWRIKFTDNSVEHTLPGNTISVVAQ